MRQREVRLNQEVSPADLVQGGPDLKPKSDVKQVTANNFAANDATPDNVIAIDGPKAIIRSLTRAASNLDATGCDQVISKYESKAHGVVWTWEQVLLPVLDIGGSKNGPRLEKALIRNIFSPSPSLVNLEA